jgi:hypothetical protein
MVTLTKMTVAVVKMMSTLDCANRISDCWDELMAFSVVACRCRRSRRVMIWACGQVATSGAAKQCPCSQMHSQTCEHVERPPRSDATW